MLQANQRAIHRVFRALLAFAAALLFAGGSNGYGQLSSWTDRESRLANEYLGLLVSQPEYGRVIDLLWNLYEKHDATKLLLENVQAQARRSGHPAALLVLGHLQRKSGDLARAAETYDSVLASNPQESLALRARADLAKEAGDSAKAYALLQRWAEQLAPHSAARAAAWLELGAVALSCELPAEAADWWEKAAAAQPPDRDRVRQAAEWLLRAGFADRAAAFYTSLAEQGDPQQRLDALLDLARIREHADQFSQADATLRRGLGMLDFRDLRYADFFARRVRLHERFGALDELSAGLRRAAAAQPPEERALRDLVRFFQLTVEPDEHLKWLRALSRAAPANEEYTWELVRALLEHEGAAEAAALLDARLKGDGTDAVAAVFLRCEADLRLGKPEAARDRLAELLRRHQGVEDLEKQILAFAQARSLDLVIETILRSRVERDPGRAESVFELAAFYRARKDMTQAEAVLRGFATHATTDAERQKRLSEAAAFLASGDELDSAIILAREAAAKATSGRAEWLRLAELLAEHGDTEEARDLLGKAWRSSATDEERVEADERLFSVLMGGALPDSGTGAGPETFKLPDAYTGAGFGTDAADHRPAGRKPDNLPEAVTNFASGLMSAVILPATVQAQESAGTGRAALLPRPDATPAELFRCLWWASRLEWHEEAYAMLRALTFDRATGAAVELALEAEKLCLELALQDGNKALTQRCLRRLAQRDPAGRIRYTLRLSEQLMEMEHDVSATVQTNVYLNHAVRHWDYSGPIPIMQNRRWRFDSPGVPSGQQATTLLERARQENPDSEALLGALTECYTLQRRHDEAAKLWKRAIERAPAGAVSPLLERFADLMLRQQRLPEFVKAQVDLLERESDTRKRRESFKRFLDRLLWNDQGGELLPEQKRERLALVAKSLTELSQRHPFDAFFPEAQALVYERDDQHAKAFAAMKRAYYTTPETPFSLAQLRDAALRVEDVSAAIYFQKQIAARAPQAELAAESRRLVELLEQTFQIAEADRVRRRLESKFSQDAAALEGLAEHYTATGQDEAERRVYEQIARVRPWDARSQLRLALKCLRLADESTASKHLREILERTASDAFADASAPIERLPLPLADARKPGTAAPVTEVSALLDTAAALERDELARLRAFFATPRAEFSELPEAAPLVRLRAIEELAKLALQHGGDALEDWHDQWQNASAAKPPVELLWALYYSGAGTAARAAAKQLLDNKPELEAQFCLVWLFARSQGVEEALAWTQEEQTRPASVEVRKRLLQAAASMLAGLDNFRFLKGQLTALGTARIMQDAPLRDMTRRLQDQQRYDEALELGESLRRTPYSPMDDFILGRIAEAAERWDLARHYLGRVVRSRPQPSAFRGAYDPYLASLSTSYWLAQSSQEQDQMVREAWRLLQSMPDSTLTALHRTAVAGLAGAGRPAADRLADLITGGLVSARQIGDGSGTLMPQGVARGDEPVYLKSLWQETRELQASLVQQGLGPVVQDANDSLARRWGSITLSSRNAMEFDEWRLNHLLRQMRAASFPNRLRLIREHLAAVDMRLEASVEALRELGSRLETYGMAREAIEVYRLLPDRAPANPDYALDLIRACESAQETRLGLEFTLKLLLAEPPMKPPQPGDEVLHDKYAHFLALEFNLPELRRRGYVPEPSRMLQGRIPPENSYLRELALLNERMGRDADALEAWERIHLSIRANAERGLRPDTETCLHRARLLRKTGNPQGTLAALRDVLLTDRAGPLGREALALRAELAAEAGDWADIRTLMTSAVARRSLDAIAHLTEILRANGRAGEAFNFLTQAERTLKEASGRFRLRLELLRLASGNPGWSPETGRAQVAAMFRARTRDHDTLKLLVEFITQQAAGPHADAWRRVLRAEARAGTERPTAALALCPLADGLDDAGRADLAQGWRSAREGDRICLALGAEALLKVGEPDLAWTTCKMLERLPSPRLDGQKLPLMISAAHAKGDATTVRELFAEIVRMPKPGGTRTLEWIDAFEKAGEHTLAREIFKAALDRGEATQTFMPELYAAWPRFLIAHREFDRAEAFLLRHGWTLGPDLAALIFELYRGWGKLNHLSAELPKFHLTTGLEKEIRFRASQATGVPPPIPQDTPTS